MTADKTVLVPRLDWLLGRDWQKKFLSEGALRGALRAIAVDVKQPLNGVQDKIRVVKLGGLAD